jgi:hypothetical protein
MGQASAEPVEPRSWLRRDSGWRTRQRVLESGFMNRGSTVSGSPVVDRVIFGALVLIMFCAAPRLLVYHRSMQLGTTRVELAAIDANGTKVELPVPPDLQGYRLRAALKNIEAFSMTTRARALTPPAGRLEWTLRYAVDFGSITPRYSRVLITGR